MLQNDAGHYEFYEYNNGLNRFSYINNTKDIFNKGRIDSLYVNSTDIYLTIEHPSGMQYDIYKYDFTTDSLFKERSPGYPIQGVYLNTTLTITDNSLLYISTDDRNGNTGNLSLYSLPLID